MVPSDIPTRVTTSVMGSLVIPTDPLLRKEGLKVSNGLTLSVPSVDTSPS